MNVILTSDIMSPDKRQLNSLNGFVDKIHEYVDDINCLYIPSDPQAPFLTHTISSHYKRAFKKSGFTVKRWEVLYPYKKRKLQQLISRANLIILAGGHVPTQNKYFHDIHLKQYIKDYQGLVIAISAGSMNSAREVYAQPEYFGEVKSPHYHRFLKGLGIVDISVLPHYTDIKHERIDNQRIMEDVTLPDSYGRKFYAIEDGAFIIQTENKIYGNCYVIKDGKIKKVCTTGNTVNLRGVN
ncbi:Type 1 glutamine amidotransferase-like domain-containing protein [Finegoldia magna]|uniref:Type 1 glutamine amidotransferase-like domain-containing protein n=1 Tax=Finegoldia magna TaxID=1260 RepID=UPI002906F1C8|nr:Type 1 glutamine amidotransferase-like domain-containing protein [Finegoldia magna]MDU7165953.1 Type 1 glutamine amidotransferase-like domain-containing protein [Finegoldia magna]